MPRAESLKSAISLEAVREAFRVADAFLREDIGELRSLSDEILAKGAIEGSREMVELAVVAHALAKIIEKGYYRREKEVWRKFVNDVVKALREAGKNSRKIYEVEEIIKELDEKFGRYADNVIHLSKVKRGSTLYAWGISLTLASELVGVPEHEIMNHTGKTKMVDEEGKSKSASERLKEAEEVL